MHISNQPSAGLLFLLNFDPQSLLDGWKAAIWLGKIKCQMFFVVVSLLYIANQLPVLLMWALVSLRLFGV